jgi:glutamine amidotransferase
MIQIIDYGMGNLGSIANMLKKIGFKSRIVNISSDLSPNNPSILPGVGAFDNAMSKLNENGWTDSIKANVSSGAPLLGICLGMQLLGTSSEEGQMKGLDLIPGKVLRFPKSDILKVPHMGWNKVIPNDFEFYSGLLENKFYFVHSYYFSPDQNDDIAGTTNYGLEFASSLRRGLVFGAQFHPEKSHKYGMALLKNYCEISNE